MKMMIGKVRAKLGLVIMLLGHGCSLEPAFESPEIEVPQQWRAEPLQNQVIQSNLSKTAGKASGPWWDEFKDLQLSDVVSRAVKENFELLQADANLEALLARWGVAKAAEYPTVDISAAGNRARRSLGSIAGSSNGFSQNTTNLLAELDLTWELDLWDRLKNSSEVARRELLAQQSVREGLQISLVAKVVSSYFSLRAADRLLEIARETVSIRKRAVEIAQARFDSGLTSELDLRQSEVELASVRATLPAYERRVTEAEHLLSFLQAQAPRGIARGLALESLVKTVVVPEGLPSEVLLRRPDIIAAEERLRAAHAQIAVVRAEYFPRISLTGLFGFASTELSSWLDATSRTWQAGGAVVGPLFNAGKTAHKVNGARAEEQAAIAAFKLTVVGALREVEDALVAVRTTQEELKMREQQVAAAHAYLHLAESRYAAGQSSYLEVLDAQRSQFQAEVELANVQAGTLAALVSLHKVMAGNL